MNNALVVDGFQYLPNYFDETQQASLKKAILDILDHAPFFTPTMPKTGRAFSVQMSNCGTLGWVSDKENGYRYQSLHPDTTKAWPPIPHILIDLWKEVTAYPDLPEACLINFYNPKARMGLHKDCDEEDFNAPVLSISLGDIAVFRVGGKRRKDPTRSFELKSGDVVVMGGDARLAYHGVDRIKPKSCSLLEDVFPEGGRLNLTLRRVLKAQPE